MNKEHSLNNYIKKTVLKYSIIPIFFIVIIFSFLLVFFLRYQEYEIARNNSNVISEKLEYYLNKINQELLNIPNNENYMNFLNNNIDSRKTFEEFYNLKNKLNLKINLRIYENEDLILKSNANEVNFLTNKNFFYTNTTSKINDYNYLQFSRSFNSANLSYLSLYRQMYLNDNKYIIYFDIDTEFLNKLLSKESNSINTIVGKYNQVISSNNTMVYGSANKLNEVKTGFNEYLVSDNTFVKHSVPILNNNLTVISYSNKKDLSPMFFYYLIFAIFIFALTVLLIKISANKISKKNSEAIAIMNNSIQKLKSGNLKHEINEDVFLEYNDLFNEYNNMVISMNKLMEKNKEISQLNKEDELKFLQSQFNPHFIFNILETLKYTMLTDVDLAKKMIVDVSKMLRYSIDLKDNFATIEKNLNYIETYLKLQKYRYGNKLHYKLDIDKNIYDFKIPKLIIQPLIENSIKYAFKNKDTLSIYISIKLTEDSFIIIVKDDGAGISKDDIDNLYLNFNNNISKEGIGLFNVYKKLSLIYNNDFTFNINSIKDEYCCIEIVIPNSESYV